MLSTTMWMKEGLHRRLKCTANNYWNWNYICVYKTQRTKWNRELTFLTILPSYLHCSKVKEKDVLASQASNRFFKSTIALQISSANFCVLVVGQDRLLCTLKITGVNREERDHSERGLMVSAVEYMTQEKWFSQRYTKKRTHTIIHLWEKSPIKYDSAIVQLP